MGNQLVAESLHKLYNKNAAEAQTYIEAPTGIRRQYPSYESEEDSTHLRSELQAN
jgi:hypothetical protein